MAMAAFPANPVLSPLFCPARSPLARRAQPLSLSSLASAAAMMAVHAVGSAAGLRSQACVAQQERLRLRAQPGRCALRCAASAGGAPLYPLPQSAREMVREAAAAVQRCTAAGVGSRQRLQLLMPTNCRAADFTATEEMVSERLMPSFLRRFACRRYRHQNSAASSAEGSAKKHARCKIYVRVY